jgi:hypothetical protein
MNLLIYRVALDRIVSDDLTLYMRLLDPLREGTDELNYGGAICQVRLCAIPPNH